jgi:hypothetical protein
MGGQKVIYTRESIELALDLAVEDGLLSHWSRTDDHYWSADVITIDAPRPVFALDNLRDAWIFLHGLNSARYGMERKAREQEVQVPA